VRAAVTIYRSVPHSAMPRLRAREKPPGVAAQAKGGRARFCRSISDRHGHWKRIRWVPPPKSCGHRPLGCVECAHISVTPHYQGVPPSAAARNIPGYMMQRLFSTFPNSLPGAGLLLLRLCDAVLLLFHSTIISGFRMSLEGFAQLVAAGAGCLILVGLATPISAAVGAVAILCIAAPIETHIVLATAGASLALLGPGAWSIDARLYGRRRIDLDSL
jgi:putative oxidoreductase